jgi:hypothetical protein
VLLYIFTRFAAFLNAGYLGEESRILGLTQGLKIWGFGQMGETRKRLIYEFVFVALHSTPYSILFAL